MAFSTISTTLARTNSYFALSHEPHLKVLLAMASMITLTESADSRSRPELPEGFIFPLDAIVALSGGLEAEGSSTLIRFVDNHEFFRVDAVSDVKRSLVIRAGHAILIKQEVWMAFGAQFPSFLESMVDFTQGRNALAILNSTCSSSHRYSKRVARLLLEARTVFPKSDPWIPLSQNTISLLLNTRRETVALELQSLSTAGAIETKRAKIRIIDMDVLRQRSCACFDKSVELATYQTNIAKKLFAAIPPGMPVSAAATPRRQESKPKTAVNIFT